jgi:hypothetical protein
MKKKRNNVDLPGKRGTTLTIEILKEWFEDIVNNNINQKKEVVIWQGCLDQGGVERSSHNLNLCSNPKCVSCRMYDDLLYEESKKFKIC